MSSLSLLAIAVATRQLQRMGDNHPESSCRLQVVRAAGTLDDAESLHPSVHFSQSCGRLTSLGVPLLFAVGQEGLDVFQQLVFDGTGQNDGFPCSNRSRDGVIPAAIRRTDRQSYHIKVNYEGWKIRISESAFWKNTSCAATRNFVMASG